MNVEKVQKDLIKITKCVVLAANYLKIGDDKNLEYEIQAIEWRLTKIRDELKK